MLIGRRGLTFVMGGIATLYFSVTAEAACVKDGIFCSDQYRYCHEPTVP